MNVPEITALVGSLTALVVAIGGIITILRSNAKQNVKAEERAAKLEDIHAAIVPGASKP